MREEEFLEKYCSKLNSEQLKAVQSVDGHTLLLAVPGSGKTTVLVTRLGYMVQCKGISPDNILTVTYTTAATRDMKHRYESLFSNESDNYAERLEFRTINSLCLSILNRYCNLHGKTMDELITDKDAVGICTGIYRKYNQDYPTESDISQMRTLISYVKNMRLSEDEIKQLGEKERIQLWEYYQDYKNALKKRKLMDYDDQLTGALAVLTQSPDICKYYQDKYKYICVDESQDTSKIQHIIIAKLVGNDGNLFMVGDEDQSIYGFRAAFPEALLAFDKNYKNATTLVMKTNYRSGTKIVDAAEYFIKHNRLRHNKRMVASRTDEGSIRFITIDNRSKQYPYLLDVAANASRQIAVLYRENDSIIPLVDLLEREKIAYRIKGSYAVFFSNRVVIDIVSVLKFALDNSSLDSFKRIYPKVRLYLKKQQAEELCEKAEKQEKTIFEVLDEVDSLDENKKRDIKGFENNVKRIRQLSTSDALAYICGQMGYAQYLKDNEIDDSRIFILKELAKNEAKIPDFIARLDYLQQKLADDRTDYDAKFILSTIHSSKGLEYDEVYLIDIGDGIFPKKLNYMSKPIDSREYRDFEEERRIFYVGITRAKNQLHIFCIKNMHAEFLDEMKKPNPKVVNNTSEKPQKPKATIKGNANKTDRKGTYSQSICKYRTVDGKCNNKTYINFGLNCKRPYNCHKRTTR